MSALTGIIETGTSVHTSRTLMLSEISRILEVVNENADLEDYTYEIIEQNILGKPTINTRRVSARYLAALYALDKSVPVFRLLRELWNIDQSARPLLAATCAIARDPLLRLTLPSVLRVGEGEPIGSETFADVLRNEHGDHFSPTTVTSFGQNVASSWTQSGHIRGKIRKRRSHVKATPVNAAYSMALGYLQGVRGENLLYTPWAKVLDCHSTEDLLNLVVQAWRNGWLDYRRIADVIDIRLDPLLLPQEMDICNE